MPVARSRTTHITLVRFVALLSGIAGSLCAIAIPFLPVDVDEATIDWNGKDTAAPLVSYAPLGIDVTVPCAKAKELGTDGGTLFSTIPPESESAQRLGLVIEVKDGFLNIVLRNKPLIDSTPVAGLADCSIAVRSTIADTTTTVDGPTVTASGDFRPQVVGLFSDVDDRDGITARLDLDTRFTSSATAVKLAAIVGAVVFTLIALVAIGLLDRGDNRRHRRLLPTHWKHISLADIAVVATLAYWHIVGANTSDDGYILTMAREAEHSGYMSNYYRWYGVAEAPFGWYYDTLALITKISTASPVMRLPALLCGLLCWLLISREVIPRLGAKVRRNQLALWTAGLVFLCFWLPYDNGLRPEPIIALGALLTWCLIERSIATGRLLPAALALLVAAFSLAAGPSGLICIAALIAGSRGVLKTAIRQTAGTVKDRVLGLSAVGAAFAAVGTVVITVGCADQTYAAIQEATRVRSDIGPNWKWFDERVRWDYLLMITTDGSLSRRFGVFVMLLCLVACVILISRNRGRMPGTTRGPSARLVGVVVGALFFMMFTPTKWTHHFGVYAGIGGALAALAAMAVASNLITSPRNRTIFAAAVMFVGALAFSSTNGWWYVSSFGVPWWDKPPTIAGKGFATLMLAATVLLLVVAALQHYLAAYGKTTPRIFNRATSAPLTIGAAFVVLFELASLTKGAISQYPAYSIAKSNIDYLTAGHCGLADEVLVETDTNASILRPVTGTIADSLLNPDEDNEGFSPNGVAEDLAPDKLNLQGAAGDVKSSGRTADTTEDTVTPGINGSTVSMPFDFDSTRVPVLGSYQSERPEAAKLTSQWFALDRSGPLLVIGVAGRIRSVDADGVVTPGQRLAVEFGRSTGSSFEPVGPQIEPIDIGPAPSWRNVRVPLDLKPADATAVRIIAVDDDLTPSQWLAVTPPRIPALTTLQEVVGGSDPVLLDWSVGLAFPCQRPFHHRNGVAEVPKYRILPDREGTEATNAWQDAWGGGPLGWTDLLLKSTTVPTYLRDDWRRDWGALEKYALQRPVGDAPHIEITPRQHSGRWNPGPIRDK